MRRFTRFAPFSQLALVAAIGALGVIVFASPAHAADPAKPAANKAATSAAAKPAATPAGDKAAAPKPADKKTKDLARKAYGEGEKAYAAGDFSAAYTGFSKANELIPSAQASYWATKSLDQSGKSDDAIKGYEALLADPNAGKIGEEKLADVHARLAALKAALVGEITVSTSTPGAVLLVDGAAQPGPLPAVLKLSPGPHKLTLSAEGYEAKEVDLQVQAGTKVQQSIEMVPKSAPPIAPVAVAAVAAPPPPPPEKHSKVPAYVTLGIAAGGAVVGTIFGVKALSSKSAFDDNPTTEHADDTERNALIADMAFGVALTLGVTGIVLLTSNDDAEAPAKAAKLHQPPKGTFRVLPYVGRESGGAAARLTF